MKFVLSKGKYSLPIEKRYLSLVLVVSFFALALWVIHNEMKAYPFETIVESFYFIPMSAVGLALLATIISYIGIAFYDGLAIRYTDKSLSWRKTVFSSCCAHAISTTLGVAALTGNAVRYRLYSSWGLNLKDVATIGVVTFMASIMSAFSLMALGLIFETQTFLTVFKIPTFLSVGLGLGILVSCTFLVFLLLKSPQKLRIKNIGVTSPSGTTLSLQWLSGSLDWIAAAAVLYVLLPANSDLTLLTFIPLFIAAQYMGSASGLPGGIGVFEAIFLILVPGGASADMAAALVLYRMVYYVFPLMVAVIVLSLHQGVTAFKFLKSGQEKAVNLVSTIAPLLYGTLTFVTGAVLLVSSAVPSFLPRIEYMARFIPEALIEVSHLFASAIGTFLLIISLGLWRRLYSAWGAAMILFPAGILFTYLNGGSFVSIAFMGVMCGCLISAKSSFYRRGQVRNLSVTPARLAALIGTLSLICGAGFYAHRNQDYSQELWWNFGLEADASRFLRASALVASIMLVYLVWRLLQPSSSNQKPESSPETLEQVRRILDQSNNSVSESNLALMGDKHFLFSESQNSFIMYGVKGRNWIALGEPVGLDSERRELLLKFHEQADLCGAWPCFYSIRSRNLNDFVDMGLSVQKIGEMALVPIKDYDLAGKAKARFRQARNRAHREGVSFDVVYPQENSDIMGRLEEISSEWLRHHKGSEKKFSMGCFDRKLLATQPIAVAMQNDEIVAFSNLWVTPDKNELSLDLMRYKPGIMTGLMDYLFTEVMVWGGAQGFEYFSLGMAPMSGLDAKNYASMMSRIGRLVYRYGGKIYGFQGLRAFKKKFNPEWQPVYLAAPSQVVMPRALSNLALLSAGGVSGLLR